MQWSIFDEIRGVWIADETQSQVFDIYGEVKLLKSALIKTGYQTLLHSYCNVVISIVLT